MTGFIHLCWDMVALFVSVVLWGANVITTLLETIIFAPVKLIYRGLYDFDAAEMDMSTGETALTGIGMLIAGLASVWFGTEVTESAIACIIGAIILFSSIYYLGQCVVVVIAKLMLKIFDWLMKKIHQVEKVIHYRHGQEIFLAISYTGRKRKAEAKRREEERKAEERRKIIAEKVRQYEEMHRRMEQARRAAEAKWREEQAQKERQQKEKQQKTNNNSTAKNSCSNALKILGLTEPISMQEIKKAYVKLIKQYHPDQVNGDVQRTKEINEAYAYLKKIYGAKCA